MRLRIYSLYNFRTSYSSVSYNHAVYGIPQDLATSINNITWRLLHIKELSSFFLGLHSTPLCGWILFSLSSVEFLHMSSKSLLVNAAVNNLIHVSFCTYESTSVG